MLVKRSLEFYSVLDIYFLLPPRSTNMSQYTVEFKQSCCEPPQCVSLTCSLPGRGLGRNICARRNFQFHASTFSSAFLSPDW